MAPMTQESGKPEAPKPRPEELKAAEKEWGRSIVEHDRSPEAAARYRNARRALSALERAQEGAEKMERRRDRREALSGSGRPGGLKAPRILAQIFEHPFVAVGAEVCPPVPLTLRPRPEALGPNESTPSPPKALLLGGTQKKALVQPSIVGGKLTTRVAISSLWLTSSQHVASQPDPRSKAPPKPLSSHGSGGISLPPGTYQA